MGCLVLAFFAVPKAMDVLVPDAVTWATIVATAKASSAMIMAVGIPCTLAEGNRLYLTNHIFRIDAACTGGLWLAMYALAVVFMPVSRKRKVQGLLIGLPVLVVFNLVRLVVVAAVSLYWPVRFYFIHDQAMQGGFVVVTVLVWVGWMWLSRDDWKPGWE